MHLSVIRAIFCALAFTLPAAAFAALATTFEADYEDESKSWKEIEAQLPGYPRSENLIEVVAGSETPHRFYIDATSVSLGADGVLRYASVVKTAGGALNVSFEGMRCQTRELKVYALGRKDGTWARARKPEWKRILMRDLTPQHWVLYRQYFCPSPALPTPPRTALDALRRGEGLAPAGEMD
ncbi:MAG TPA: CNP1-like family protein [Burkholderiales bacterium]|nr:CNP1-like family protein [Burkholderiales bacterium]